MLTKREIEILKLQAEGLTGRKIATKLSISEKTVKVHTYNIQNKMKARNVAHSISIGYETGVLTKHGVIMKGKFILRTLLTMLFMWAFIASGQIVVAAQPAYDLPYVLQTFPAKMLCTNNSTGWFSSNNAYSKEGFITLGGSQWTPIYLDDKKKLIDTTKITIWFWIKK